MKLYIDRKLWSIWGKYDVFFEDGDVACTVKGHPSLGRKLTIHDPDGREIGMLKQIILRMFATFEIWRDDVVQGYVNQKFSLLHPKLEVDYRDWYVEGDFFQWHFVVYNSNDDLVGRVDQEIWHLTDHYVIEANSNDALDVLMLVLAISAIKDAQRQQTMYNN